MSGRVSRLFYVIADSEYLNMCAGIMHFTFMLREHIFGAAILILGVDQLTSSFSAQFHEYRNCASIRGTVRFS